MPGPMMQRHSSAASWRDRRADGTFGLLDVHGNGSQSWKRTRSCRPRWRSVCVLRLDDWG